MSEILTPKDYLTTMLNNSELNKDIFANYIDIENARFAIMDQLLNTIGNGIYNVEDLIKELSIPENKLKSIEEIEAYYGSVKYTGFKKIIIYHEDGTDERVSIMPENLDGLVFTGDYETIVHFVYEKDKGSHEDVIYWKKSAFRKLKWEPFPSFRKKNNPIYQGDLNILGDKKNIWIDEFIFFYNGIIEYLKSASSIEHRNSYPSNNPKEDESVINFYRSQFKKYDSHSEISIEYGIEFNGNIEEFAKNRWEKRKAKWILFSEEIIKYLESKKD